MTERPAAPGVYRDGWGIPHLWGDTVEELAHLQGRTAATDRAWQIEVERWRSEGRLAEHLGPAELDWDRFARRVRLDDTARRCFERLDPPTRRWVGAYVDGVNEGLAVGAEAAPEFAATGCRPGRWRPWTPLGVFLVQHVLFGTFPNKLWRADVAAALGPAGTVLFGPGHPDDPDGSGGPGDSGGSGGLRYSGGPAELGREGPGGAGSNAWAVPGDPGLGSAPLIAGDPHRLLELPGIYQQVRLACPEFDVVGLAFPGVPGVPHFGHAGAVAWAVTNAMADYQDVYRERLRRVDGRVLVREPDGWAPVPAYWERIEVRGHPAESVEVIETPRGPVVDVDRRTGEAISLRTPSRVEADLGFGALLPLLRAKSAAQVAEALRGWVEPVNSVLVADRAGTVLRLVAGLVPVRDEECRRLPVPGWEPRYRWRPGYAPLPRAEFTTVTVAANDRRPGDVAELGTDFSPPHRARRIAALLADGAAPAAVHVDDRLAAEVLRDLLARLAPGALGPAARALRDRLLAWDGRMAAESTDAGAFAAWRAALARRLAAHPRLRPLRAGSGFDPLFAPWTDAPARIGYALDAVVRGLHRLGGEVEPEAAAALEEVARGEAPGPWGARHRLRPVRLPVDPAIDASVAEVSEEVRLSGDTDCVLATSSLPGVSDACWRGPVARYVWDLGDRSRSRWVVPFGASGHPGDPHFADQLPLWTEGELIPVVTEWGRLTRQPE
ncbi:penicillin acylase family protein [Micromonospora sp. NPDC049559]|uniref:penicillin acylase family protein n=1 Tax=Micromonospora sp. NPDC049559 TaxID=3155923 RepID=UPI0034126532